MGTATEPDAGDGDDRARHSWGPGTRRAKVSYMTLSSGANHGADGSEIGEQVVQAALADLRCVFGGRLVSAYRLGSLAHGGFSPEVSDVDVAAVLDELEPDDAEQMAGIRARVAQRCDVVAAQRLSIFWSTWQDLCTGVLGTGRFPLVDRLDLARDGQCVHGVDRRSEVARPNASALRVEGAEFIVARLTDPSRDAMLTDPAALLRAGVREASKAVLFPVRFIATADTGDVLSNPDAATHVVATRPGAVAELTAAALVWRQTGLGAGDEGRAADTAVLAAGLPPLYAALADAYGPRLQSAGRPELAAAIDAWVQRLWPTHPGPA